jgi:hypothetical protein
MKAAKVEQQIAKRENGLKGLKKEIVQRLQAARE